EYRERLHRRLDETETSQSQQTDETTIDERDLQTTERASVKEESQHDADLTIGVEAQVNVSAQYGPMHVDTHVGGVVEYSVHDSRGRATEQAKETVQRAISRVERRVQQARTTRTLT